MRQVVEEHTSLWRIRDQYKKDADCDSCRSFWPKLEQDKENHINELTNLIKQHLT
jgi:hypothetical protein